ncbi:MAG TPA: UvrD-helicase domain-containing protein [Acidimicrobiales bacterium]|nr:UvrD-helicase domain-containing protein [Acidimicrobiales bacterium]
MAAHPDLSAEQAHIDRAYDNLERSRVEATRLRSMVEVGRGGTEQARWEREMIEGNIAQRLASLQLGDASLVFGRIDRTQSEGGDSFYIGRLAVSDERREPLVVDWRAPVAEPFYRATGRSPMGLVRRRHFATRGRQLLAIEDELFGESAGILGGELSIVDEGREIRGQSTLIAALEEVRTGRLTDIVSTIQGEQDEVIRGELPGILVVQGGPGTGKTVVALHRAAYLLYTHRFPLEGQGVLVVGPNRLFLGYIEQVLPSLGEAGVELAVLADLIEHSSHLAIERRDRAETARVKGDLRMAKVVHKAVHDRQRPLREPLRVGHGVQTLTLSPRQSKAIVADARRRFRLHNAGRRHVEASVYATLAESARVPVDADDVRGRLHSVAEVREALDRMWPVLTPAELLHDLFGSRALIDLAAEGLLHDGERAALHRPRSAHADEAPWTHEDAPLLDEARALLGPKPRRRRTNGTAGDDDVRTYGHIVVDEAQDLSPMQLRMLNRRSLNGSMTVVGDIAQSTGAWAHADWEEVLEHLPDRRAPRRAELTIGYRLPGPNMRLAAKVLELAAPGIRPPSSVRQTGDEPRFVQAEPGGLGAAVVAAALEERSAVDPGSVAVIVPDSLVETVSDALDAAGVEYGRAVRSGLSTQITVVPVGLVKGLELDASVVVEPAAILDEEAQGARALYVALTRATKRLVLVHERDLPGVLTEE